MMKRFLILPLVAMLALVGCGREDVERTDGPRVQARRKPPTTLSINLGSRPSTLDPTLATEISAHKVMLGLFDPLVRLDADSNPVPSAAHSWEHNEDYTKWTFHLREDGRWHNGDPVTSHDFKYAVERLLTPEVAAQYSGLVRPLIKGGEEFYDNGGLAAGLSLDSVTAPDDHTIVYETAYPAPYLITFLQLFTFMPVHRPTLEEHGIQWSIRPATYVGNGPFRFDRYQGRVYYMKKADTYWDAENIYWEDIEFFAIEDVNTENSAFLSGDLDITEGVAIPELPRWRDTPYINESPWFGTYYVAFNTQRPPLDNVLVRKALSMAIDRELIVNRVTRRQDPISEGFVPRIIASPRGGTYGEQRGNLVPAYDMEMARALLEQAGYGSGNPVPAFEYLYNTSDEHKAIGEQLQAMWKRAGVQDVRLQNVEWGTFVNRTNTGDFMASRSSWIGDYLDPMTFLELFTAGHAKNTPQYNNPEYDALIDAARREIDAVKREDMMIQAERMIMEEDCIVAPIFEYVSPILVRTDIEGFERNVVGNFLYTHARRIE